MYTQVVYRYAGETWRTFGPVVVGSDAQETYEECRKQHPSAMVGRVVGASLADVEAKLNIVHDLDSNRQEALRPEGPRDVPLLEMGPGGDKDTPYTYTPPPGHVAAKWLRLLAQFQRGEVGGPHDGEDNTEGVLVA